MSQIFLREKIEEIARTGTERQRLKLMRNLLADHFPGCERAELEQMSNRIDQLAFRKIDRNLPTPISEIDSLIEEYSKTQKALKNLIIKTDYP